MQSNGTRLREMIVEEAVTLRKLKFPQVELPSCVNSDHIRHRKQPASKSTTIRFGWLDKLRKRNDVPTTRSELIRNWRSLGIDLVREHHLIVDLGSCSGAES